MKIAFAGTGYINKVHARAAQTAGLELVAVVNHKKDSMLEFGKQFNISRHYETVEAMLKDGNVDALVVSTPNYLHSPQTIAALKAGVHVMVEKPMAMNAAEAEQMCEAADKSGATLMVAHCWRFDPDVLWLKEQSKKLGKNHPHKRDRCPHPLGTFRLVHAKRICGRRRNGRHGNPCAGYSEIFTW